MARATRSSARHMESNGDGSAPISTSTVPQEKASIPSTDHADCTNPALGTLSEAITEAHSAIAKLEALGLSQREKIPLPRCVVLGEQSTGKSSVIEAISGITTPRSTDTCTRCALYIQLQPTKDQWHARVCLRKSYVWDGKKRTRFPFWRQTEIVEEEFKSTTSLVELEHIIADAQLATLTPYSGAEPCEFSPNVVCIYVSCPTLEQPLSFYDLPGIIGQTEEDRNQYLVKFVKDLVCEYIQDSLVLVVCSLENDIANSVASGLARTHKVTNHCIRVLTKPDRLPVGSREDKLREVLAGNNFKLGHGYFVVKNPGQSDLDNKLTHGEARSMEDHFFTNNEPWATTFGGFHDQFGTNNLRAYLSDKLAAQILGNLPQIRKDTIQRLAQVETDLSHLPQPPANPMRTVTDLILNFSNHIGKEMQADLRNRSWHNEWEKIHQQLFKDLESMKPKLRVRGDRDVGIFPVSADNTADNAILITDDEGDTSPAAQTPVAGMPSTPKKRKWDVDSTSETSSPFKRPAAPDGDAEDKKYSQFKMVFMLDDMAKYLNQSKSRLPDLLDPRAVEDLIHEALQHWEEPLRAFFYILGRKIESNVKAIFQHHFGRWSSSPIYNESWKIVLEILKSSLAELHMMALHSLNDEREGPVVFFESTASEEHERMRDLYRDARTRYRSSIYQKEYREYTNRHPVDLDKLRRDEKVWSLITAEPYENEINLIAKVTSYYEIASRRFYEAIAIRVQSKFFKRLRTDLRDELESNLGINEIMTGGQQAVYLLAEDSHRLDMRNQLLSTQGTLKQALAHLDEVDHKYGLANMQEQEQEDAADENDELAEDLEN
ncbi:unnamed protein product [Periconia digitata]|uniref:GED domain-containing protein n=1 Tax=Periconia digitata TaxID=1303443 RepID=A0A9W4XKC4_9PLEO|nr:unnamed protein product [Periconia digitata]